MGHHDGNGDDMQPSQRLRCAFVVTHQATEARHPGEPSLDHPTPRQQNKAPHGRWQLDHLYATASAVGCSPV